MKAFCLRQSRRTRRTPSPRCAPELEKAMPLGGGQDLLARMKDYVTQPDRIVNVKDALDATVTPMPGGGLKIGAAMKMADLAEHAEVAQAVSGDRAGGDRSRHAADPQPGHRRRQPESAAALLVLPQRRVRLLQEGRQPVLLAGRREPVPRDLRRRPELHRPSVEPGGAVRRLRRDVPAARPEGRADGAGGRLLHDADAAERADARTCWRPNELLTHVILPAPGSGQERALRGALQGIARLADRVRDGRC